MGPAVPCLPLCLLPQLLWALVHAGYPLDPLFLQQLLAATRRQMGQAGRQDLGQLAWALGKLRAAPEPAWVEAFCEAVLQVGGRWGGGLLQGAQGAPLCNITPCGGLSLGWFALSLPAASPTTAP